MASGSGMPPDFTKTCIYKANAPARQICRDLEQIAATGESFASGRRRWGWIAVLALTVGILLLLAGLGTGDEAGGSAGVLMIAALVLLGLALWSFLKYRAFKGKCFDERVQRFLTQTLRMVETDMAPEAPVDLNLDLRPHDHEDKFTRTVVVGEWTTKYYTSPWLAMGGKLLDGTVFRLNMTTFYQARQKSRKNARGKTKVKKKTKEFLRARLHLRVKPERYVRVEELARSAGDFIQLPETVTVRRFQATGDSLDLETQCGAWGAGPPEQAAPLVSGPHMVAMMFLSLYQVLNGARKIGKGQSGGGRS